jgi:two-component system, OmpR family, sensor histidine kinase KdpD
MTHETAAPDGIGTGGSRGGGGVERIVVALGDGPGAELLLRRAATLSGQSGSAELLCIHVIRADGRWGAPSSELAELRRLTAASGTSLHTVVGEDVAEALLQFAEDVGATQMILGADPRRALGPFRSGTTGSVVRAAGALDVHLVPVPGLEGFRGAGRRRGGLSPRRRVLGWVAAAVLPPAVTVISLAAGDLIGPTSAALVFMLAVVGVALIGGIGAAVVSAVGATVLLNYFFTPPLHSFAVVEPQHLLALVLLLLAAVLVALVVHNAARRGQQAVRARAEAALLTDFAITVMTEPDPLGLLLEKVREAFAATSVALLERDRDGWRQVAAAGTHPAAAPERAEVDVTVDDDRHVVLSGRVLSAPERHVLRGVAGQAVLALRAQRLAAEAIEAKRRAEATELRGALLSAVGHDLRTPLTAIKAAAGSLRDPDLQLSAADAATQLATVEECADRLQALVDNLLDSARLAAGGVEPQLRAVGYDEILAPALATVDAGHLVTVELENAVPPVLADPGLLERVVANLITNALTHGCARTVVARTAVRGDQVQLRVSDHGPGLPTDRTEAMFAPFQRRGDRDATSGVGLGLAVARGFTEAMGGTLQAEPTPGQGLTMVITLPADPTAPTTARSAGTSTAVEPAR